MTVELAPPRRAWSDRRRITVYLLISYLVSWAAWPLTLLNPSSAPFLPYGPTIAALVLTAWAGRRGDLRDLLRRLVRWRVHPAWYATAFLLPVLLFGAAVLIAVALGVPADTGGGPFPWAALPTLFAVRTIFGGPLGEEPGWRGYLLPLLRRRHGALAASLLIGLSGRRSTCPRWCPGRPPASARSPSS
ncbi:CPBP family intramembrane metalloprotease [Actinoplanes sp. NBC_00393]|uniref:CPBP family intramembrane glutamic endopeptidase n=1 Tax=Actinoplanes sp. NBC_00393 TaxID=2975953 RepID=UPI002E1F272C